MLKVLLSVVAIVVCGGIGGTAGWLLASTLQLSGVPAALLAAVTGVAVAVAVWAAAVAAFDRMRSP